MARNYFGGGDTMDVLAAGQAGWDNTQANIDSIMRKRAAYRAGPRIAAGDYGGAAAEYDSAGFDAEAATMRGAQDRVDQQAAIASRQQEQDDLAKSKQNLEILGELTHDLAKVPVGQRLPALQARLPILQHIGVDPTPFSALTEDQLSDDALRMFGSEVSKAYTEIKQVGDNLIGVTPEGEAKVLYQGEGKGPTSAEQVIAPLLAKQARGEPLTPTEKRLVDRWYNGTPAKGRGGGGGRGGVASGVPAGFVLD